MEPGALRRRCDAQRRHPLGSPYVRDQLSLRALPLNEMRLVPEGDFVLYLMQSTQRIHENWALRYATIEADRVQAAARPSTSSIRPTTTPPTGSTPSSCRARATSLAAAEAAGSPIRFRCAAAGAMSAGTVEQLAARAGLIVTDLYPTAGVAERTARLARPRAAACVAVDSVGVMPAAIVPRRSTRRGRSAPRSRSCATSRSSRWRTVRRGVHSPPRCSPRSPSTRWTSPTRHRAPRSRAATSTTASRPRSTEGGLRRPRAAARDSSTTDCSTTGAPPRTRRTPAGRAGSRRISATDMIAPPRSCRAACSMLPADRARRSSNEMITWRELSLNFCLRNPAHESLAALPDVGASLDGGARARPARGDVHARASWRARRPPSRIWNAGQRELLRDRPDAQRRAHAVGQVGAHVDANVRRRARVAAAPQQPVRARWPRPEQLREHPVVLRQVRPSVRDAAGVGDDPADVAAAAPREVRRRRVHRAVVRADGDGAGASGADAGSARRGDRTLRAHRRSRTRGIGADADHQLCAMPRPTERARRRRTPARRGRRARRSCIRARCRASRESSAASSASARSAPARSSCAGRSTRSRPSPRGSARVAWSRRRPAITGSAWRARRAVRHPGDDLRARHRAGDEARRDRRARAPRWTRAARLRCGASTPRWRTRASTA